MIGTVEGFRQTQRGANQIKILGEWYFAGRTDISYLKKGQKIDFVCSIFGDKNQFRGVNSFTVIEGNGVHAPPAKPAETQAASAEEPREVFLHSEHLPCISNVLAHLIAAKTITTPQEGALWIAMLRAELTGKTWIPF